MNEIPTPTKRISDELPGPGEMRRAMGRSVCIVALVLVLLGVFLHRFF